MKIFFIILAIAALVVSALFVTIRLTKNSANTNTTSTTTNTYTTTNQTTDSTVNTNTAAVQTITWMETADGWQASGTPSACPTVIQAPADLTTATSILYPGQTRGNDYKPHGGVRFDTNTTNEVSVHVPMSGDVVRGSRYLVDGEVQYMFDIITPCGLMVRLGHLRELSPTFAAIAQKFPAAVEGDSQTTRVDPPASVTAGDEVATKVGIIKGHNTFFDFGVYNVLVKNAASQNATYAATHDVTLAQHAICWFSLMSTTDKAIISKLPAADPTSGKKSDYCTPADLVY